MSRGGRIDASLREALRVDELRVLDESHMHAVPAGAETHFRVLVVSPDFEGLTRVARHRRVHGLLASELSTGLHALALQLFTPGEWAEEATLLESPACLGGSKRDRATEA